MIALELTGQQFGRLTALRCVGTDVHNKRVWECACLCGGRVAVSTQDLRKGHTKSCGCLHKEQAAANGRLSTTHGHSRPSSVSPEYRTWRAMRARCNNPNATGYDRYGARGICVCERWHAFENFLADMGARPPGTSIDRFPDNNGNYEPGNCRWATRPQQAQNKRRQREAVRQVQRRKDGSGAPAMTAFGLTPELLRVFRFIDQYIAANDYPPSYDEIAVGLGLKSKSGVSMSIQLLKDRGVIDSLPHTDRSIRILHRPGMTFLPDDLRKALEEHCARTGEKPFLVLCAAIERHLAEIEQVPA